MLPWLHISQRLSALLSTTPQITPIATKINPLPLWGDLLKFAKEYRFKRSPRVICGNRELTGCHLS